MSEKQGINRSDLVRLRRERENQQRMQRAAEVTRTPPAKGRNRHVADTQPRRKTTRSNPRASRRRFQNALLPVAPDAEMRGIRSHGRTWESACPPSSWLPC